jgi:leucyl aminopeptidase
VFKSIRLGPSRSPVRVCGVFAEAARVPGALSDIDRAAGGALARALKTPGFKGDLGEVRTADDRHLLVGLGREADFKAASLRTIGARVVRALDRMKASAASFHIDHALSKKTGPTDRLFQNLAEGMALANFRVDSFDGSVTKREPSLGALTIVAARATQRDGLARGLALGESTNYARRIAATPPNICTPAFIAQEARRMARSTGLSCKVIDYREAVKRGMGGLVNVGRGSDVKPCLVVLEHSPPRARRAKTIALVGKTITYDTGGYSLKVNNGMKGMKYDKCGGMAVLGAMHAIATLDLPVRVVALLPAAENMVNGESYRPDDIITMYNGATVEVTNTDAEGRLVLADALTYACRDVEADVIVDLATLTGGVVVALGSWCAGVFCDDDDVRRRIDAAAETTGERVWRLPLWPDHREFMRAKHADLWNSGPKRDGHPIQGAAFLSFFVDEKLPWAHIDIAGVSNVEADTDLFCLGPTGYGVRLMTEFVESYG